MVREQDGRKERLKMTLSERIFLGIGLAWLLIFISLVSYYSGYRSGQIDAIKGIIKYERSNKEVWVPIQREEK
jgi:hypothetical protein